VAKIVVDPPELDALASACRHDGGEIMSLSATLGTHVATAGLGLLAAYGISIGHVVDQLAHIAGGPDGVLRVAYRFSDNADGVEQSRDAFLRADGQPVPTSHHAWSWWNIPQDLENVRDSLLEEGDKALDGIAATAGAVMSGLARFEDSATKSSLEWAEKGFDLGHIILRATEKKVEAQLARAFGKLAGEFRSLANDLGHLAGKFDGEARSVLKELGGAAKDLKDAALWAEKHADLIESVGKLGGVLDGISIVTSVASLVIDVVEGKDDTDITLDVLAVASSLLIFVPGIGPVLSLVASTAVLAAQEYHDHPEDQDAVDHFVGKKIDELDGPAMAGTPLSPVLGLAKYYKDHPAINQPVNRALGHAWDFYASHTARAPRDLIGGAATQLSGDGQVVRGVWDSAMGDPDSGGDEVLGGLTKVRDGLLQEGKGFQESHMLLNGQLYLTP
jgi:hypothetical protein